LQTASSIRRPVDPAADNHVSCAEGDVVFIPRGEGPDWSDPEPVPSPDAVGLEAADQTAWFLFDDAIFELPLTYAHMFQAQRSAYLLFGKDGANRLLWSKCASSEERLLALSALEARLPRPGGARRGADAPAPEPFDERSAAAKAIMKEAKAQILAHAEKQIERLTPLIQKHALARLKQAHDEIDREAAHYISPGFLNSLDVVLRLRGTEEVQPRPGLDLNPLRTDLRQIRALHERVIQLERQRHLMSSTQRDPMEKMVLQSERKRRREALQQTEDELAKARARLTEARIAASDRFPIAWKVWHTSYLRPEESSSLVIDIAEALRTCRQANEALRDSIAAHPENVWEYPVLIDQALEANQVPQFCIARAAALELVPKAGATRRGISQLALASGLTSMAVLAAGSVVAPPVAIAVLAIDAVLSLADAAAEYDDYVKKERAFAACLDPRKAIAAEPSLLTAALIIGLDMLGAATFKVPR
jgi:hypothetical protein